MTESQSLYAKIGGREAVEAVVSDFYDRVFADPLLEPYFDGIDREALYSHQVQFISAVAGGPVSYDGADMQQAHEGMGITEDAFDRVALYLTEALEENGVAEDDIETIIEQVAGLESDIVGQ
ncbi:group I truncated hemoglobin [Haloplanus halobius]|uniref:group I truncated hemoglobin n=1 Tax=Haloplanus halobius TaxID=2934938 RepID=UPI00200F5D3F|nr:group 1 truncated hemoglobin [Haloplanus sp. XH21]